MSAPERIWAKTHGMSTDVSGKRGLIGGWNEHQRDGQVEYLRADIAASQIAEARAERDAQLAETQRAWNERDGEKRKRLAAEAERDRLTADMARLRDGCRTYAKSLRGSFSTRYEVANDIDALAGKE